MSGDSEQIGQEEIEELLRNAQSGNAPAEPSKAEATNDAGALGQAEIEALINGGGGATAPVGAAAAPQAAADGTSAAPASARQSNPGDDIELLLNQAEQAIASVDDPIAVELKGIAPFELKDFTGTPATPEKATLELLRDVELDLKIELGRTHMYLEDVLKLRKGAVVTLDKLAGDPVDIYVNGRRIAQGEVLVLNDNFCVRVAELITGDDTN